jgi:excisionase family DNA binding protein
MMTDEPAWLSTAETAERLDIALQGVYRLIDQGHLDGYRFGRVIRLKAEDVERYRGGGGAGVPAKV